MISTPDAFAALGGLLGARAFGRMAATGAGDPIPVSRARPYETLSAIVPVLDEAARLGPALESLCAQPPALREIVVADGGSHDGTVELVRAFAARDARVRLVDAGAPPASWNGKAWNLSCALGATRPDSTWVMTVDADVRLSPDAVTSLLGFARGAYVDAFSAAPAIELHDPGEALLHPALLATLVYRFGVPGSVARSPREVLADGQLFVARRELLVRSDAFGFARASRCEDVTAARKLVADGASVGFFEGGAFARVAGYGSFEACLRNWPRSLGLGDRTFSNAETFAALAAVAFAAALPPWFALAALASGRRKSRFFTVNAALTLARFAVLAGTRRAYATTPTTFWLAPLFDVVAVAAVARAAAGRRAVWRGRTLVEAART